MPEYCDNKSIDRKCHVPLTVYLASLLLFRWCSILSSSPYLPFLAQYGLRLGLYADKTYRRRANRYVPQWCYYRHYQRRSDSPATERRTTFHFASPMNTTTLFFWSSRSLAIYWQGEPLTCSASIPARLFRAAATAGWSCPSTALVPSNHRSYG